MAQQTMAIFTEEGLDGTHAPDVGPKEAAWLRKRGNKVWTLTTDDWELIDQIDELMRDGKSFAKARKEAQGF